MAQKPVSGIRHIALAALVVIGALYLFVGASAPDAASVPEQTSASRTPVSADNRPVLMVVGDSLSAGYGLSSLEQSWVSLLQQRLNSKGYGIRVVNASISGDTSQGGASRLPGALQRHRPTIVVIELGGNDGLRGFPLDTMRGNFETMLRAVREADANPILLGMMIPPNYGQRYANDFRDQYVALAKDFAAPLVPFFLEDVALSDDLMQSDGIHPNERAQPLMLDAVWPTIEAVVRKRLSDLPVE